MNVVCTSDVCPIALNSKCVFYESSALPNTGIATNDSLQVALQKIEAAIAAAGEVDSVNGQVGVVVLTAADVGAAASGDNISIFTNDSGYITGAIADADYWKTTGVTTLSGDPVINIDPLGSISIYNSIGDLGLNISESTINFGGGEGSFILVNSDASGSFSFIDNRTSPEGIQYVGNYSATFTDRSLADWGNVWKRTANFDIDAQLDVTVNDRLAFITAPGGAGVLTSAGFAEPNFNGLIGFDFKDGDSGVHLQGSESGGTEIISFVIDPAGVANTGVGAVLTDNRTTKKGIEYAATGYVTQLHSLTDKEYVDLAVAAGGGITNSAVANELMMSDGTNAISSNVHMSGTGSTLTMTLGNSSYTGSNRIFGSAGSAANVGLQVFSKGVSELLLGGAPVVAQSNTTTLGAVLTSLKVRTRTAGGVEVAGIGVAIAFETETDTSNFEIGGVIESVSTDVTAGNEDFDLRMHTMTAGVSSLKATLNNTGLLLSNTSGDIFSAAVAGGGRNGLLVQLSNSAGLVGSRFENDLNVAGHLYVGGSTTTNSNFGVSRQNRVALIADGASNAGMIIGTITVDDVILGAADTNLLRLSSSLNIGLFGASTFDTGVGVLALQNASTAPAASDPDLIMIYSRNSSDGTTNATLALQLEQAVESIGTFTASHKIKVWINNVEYWIQLDAV